MKTISMIMILSILVSSCGSSGSGSSDVPRGTTTGSGYVKAVCDETWLPGHYQDENDAGVTLDIENDCTGHQNVCDMDIKITAYENEDIIDLTVIDSIDSNDCLQPGEYRCAFGSLNDSLIDFVLICGDRKFYWKKVM